MTALPRSILALLLLRPPAVLAQQALPRLTYIYRHSLKRGVDSVYRAIEDEGGNL